MTHKNLFLQMRDAMQERLNQDIDALKQAQSIVQGVSPSAHTETDMVQLNGLIGSIIAKLEYQQAQNELVKSDD